MKVSIRPSAVGISMILSCMLLAPSLSRSPRLPEVVSTKCLSLWRYGSQPVSSATDVAVLSYNGLECWTWVPGNVSHSGKRRWCQAAEKCSDKLPAR